MPKDNEVDEKVMPAAWVVTNGGESCEPWLEYEQSEVDALPAVCIAEPLYSAATVAELRAEVERLREANQLYSFAMNTAGIDELKRRAYAAERRVGELENLLGAWYAEESRYGARLQAPGHHHQVPGIWDSDNGPIAGKPCAKCALWQQIRSIAGADPT